MTIDTELPITTDGRAVLEDTTRRRNLPKFGAAMSESGPAKTEDLVMQWHIKMDGEVNDPIETELDKVRQQLSTVCTIRCRYCDGCHLSMGCPLADKKDPRANNSTGVLNLRMPALRKYPTNSDEGSLRVSNLPETTTEEDVRELFQQFGKVRKVLRRKHANEVIMLVVFEDKKCAENAQKIMDRHAYDRCLINVTLNPPRNI